LPFHLKSEWKKIWIWHSIKSTLPPLVKVKRQEYGECFPWTTRVVMSFSKITITPKSNTNKSKPSLLIHRLSYNESTTSTQLEVGNNPKPPTWEVGNPPTPRNNDLRTLNEKSMVELSRLATTKTISPPSNTYK